MTDPAFRRFLDRALEGHPLPDGGNQAATSPLEDDGLTQALTVVGLALSRIDPLRREVAVAMFKTFPDHLHKAESVARTIKAFQELTSHDRGA